MPLSSTRPVLHYLDIGSLGRGEVIRLFLRDAGIDFADVRYAYDDSWPTTSTELKEKGLSVTGKLPVLEYKGKTLRQHLPILRYLARELGLYDGNTSIEKYLVDAVADMYNDWRYQWVKNIKALTDEYKAFVPSYYMALDKFYEEHSGPFLLGERITYADFAVFQSIDNDSHIGALPDALPVRLTEFKTTFEARPRIAAYLASRRNS